MKKVFSLLVVLLVTVQLFAQSDSKEILGKWKYIVNTGDTEMTGVFRIVEVDGKLSGDATVDVYTIPFTKIEYKDGNCLLK